MRAWIPLSFRGQYWFGMYVKCNTSLTHNGSMYETDCSPENDNEYVIKIPAEARQMCVQVGESIQTYMFLLTRKIIPGAEKCPYFGNKSSSSSLLLQA